MRRGFAHYFPLGSDNSSPVVGVNGAFFINIRMAISKHQHEQEKQLFEAFKKFSDLYRSKVELTGETLRKLEPFNLPLDPSQPITYKETEEICIKMPRDEYERFLGNWYQYLDLMYVSKYNPMINEELNKIHMLVQLLR